MKKPIGGNPFLDTNVLIYAFSEENSRTEIARAVLAQGGVIGVQNLNEFAFVATRKLGMSWKEVDRALSAIRVLCSTIVPLTVDLHATGLRIAQRYRCQFFDSLAIAAALEAGCGTLYSEDMRDGQVIEGVLTIRNPFRN